MSCGEMSEVYEQTPDAENSVAARLGILAVIGADHGMAAGQQRAQHDVIGATFLRMHGFDERCFGTVERSVAPRAHVHLGGREPEAAQRAQQAAEKEKKRTANEKRKEQWATMVEVSNKKPKPAPAPLQQPAAELHKETAAPDNTPAAV